MKKHFLLLLMAFMSLTGWAADLVGSKFIISNVTYSESTNPAVVDDDIYTTSDYTIDLTTWYTDEACTTQAKDGEGTAYTISTLPVGKYWVKITGIGTTYSGLKTSASFNVIAIDATIEFTAGQKKAWKADDPAKFGYTLKKKGAAWTDTDAETKLGLKTGRVAGESVAEYAYTFDWTNKNYNLTRPAANEGEKFEITAKPITAATITALKTTMVYTGKNATGIYSVKDGETTLVEGTDWSMADTKDAGTGYTPLITFKGNYSGTQTPATAFAITPAPITISIEDIEVTYDNTDKADQKASAKFTYSGIVGDDVAKAAAIKADFTAPTSVAVATAAINVGTYTLVLSEDATNGGRTNYQMKTYVPGKLTIKKAELKLAAANASKAIGAADPEFTLATPAGLSAAHKITGVTFTREPGEGAGEFKITPDLSAAKVVTKATPTTDVTANYDLKVADTKGVLTIGKAAITVIIMDAEKAYGAADPEFKFKTIGLAEGDPITVNITREKSGTAAGEAVGTYALTATVANPNEAKYSGVTVIDGVFAINKAELTFAIPAQNIEIGKTAADLVALKKNIVVSGVEKAGEDIAALYDLSFNGGVTLDTEDKTSVNQTVNNGLLATLTAAAKKNYVVKGDNKLDLDGDPEGEFETAFGKLIVGAGGGATSVTISNYTNITTYAGETKNVTITIDNRTREVPVGTAHSWAKQTWNTMVLPFEVTVAELSTQLGYAIVNVVNPEKTTEGNVVFKLEMEKIPANEPFCVKTTGAIADATTISFTGKKIVAPGSEYPSVDAGQGYKFVGAYKNLTIDQSKPLFYFLRGDNVNWARIKEGSANTWTVVPFDAYIDQSGASASARELTFTFEEIDGTTTAIKAVDADVVSNRTLKEGWYTIGGMKLQSAPTQKGVYINNGKKIIVK